MVVVFLFLSNAAKTTTAAAAVNPPLPHSPSFGLTQQQQQQQQQHHSTVYRHLPEITPGKPGRDYPLATSVPTTSFNCSTYDYPGQFADQETDCQVITNQLITNQLEIKINHSISQWRMNDRKDHVIIIITSKKGRKNNMNRTAALRGWSWSSRRHDYSFDCLHSGACC